MASKSLSHDELMGQRARKFSCVTYLSEEQIKFSLQCHWSCIRAFAYTYHDMDLNEDGSPKEPHWHIVLWLYNQSTVGRVRRWFRAMDEHQKEITTTAQPCKDVVFAYEYLYHRNDPDKYQYNEHDIRCSDRELFKSDDPDDNAVNALNDILYGVPLQEVMQRYGRDVIFHYSHLRQIVCDIRTMERGYDPYDERRYPDDRNR